MGFAGLCLRLWTRESFISLEHACMLFEGEGSSRC